MHIHGRTRRAPSPMRRAKHAPKFTKVHGCTAPRLGSANFETSKAASRAVHGRSAMLAAVRSVMQGRAKAVKSRHACFISRNRLSQAAFSAAKKQIVNRKRVSRKSKQASVLFMQRSSICFKCSFQPSWESHLLRLN